MTFRPAQWLEMAAQQLLAAGASMAEARLEGRILLAAALTVDYAWLLAHAEDDLPCDSAWQQAQEGLSRRLAGEPMAYILGVV